MHPSKPHNKKPSQHRLCLIPLDARPVCYDLPKRLASAASIELMMPSPKLLGKLKEPANFKALGRWFKNHLFENAPIIVALDTVAYGGLIPSRTGTESIKEITERLDAFFKYIKAPTVYGFSSIMRIPNANNASEEPDYYQIHGKSLYEYSVQHSTKGNNNSAIPEDVLKDFLSRRQRNLKVNESYISRLSKNQLNYLTYCQDDTGSHGLNVDEASQLNQQIKAKQINTSAHIQTGADEVACTMFARWMSETFCDTPIKIHPIYSHKASEATKLIARFDGKPLKTVVEQQIKSCGAIPVNTTTEADLTLLIHTPSSIHTKDQGDHCDNIKGLTTTKQHQFVLKHITKAFKNGERVMIADVSHANGSDPSLTEKLVCHSDDLSSLYGYAGWNTPGNTIGTSVAMGVVRLVSERTSRFSAIDFNKLLLIRLGDDWLYQADIRSKFRQQKHHAGLTPDIPDDTWLSLTMASGLALIQSRLGLDSNSVQCRFPCQRDFEIELMVQ